MSRKGLREVRGLQELEKALVSSRREARGFSTTECMNSAKRLNDLERPSPGEAESLDKTLMTALSRT